jgi:Mrp family chromosome partitioning ATPase/uncharacterized protein involved in exopolysaccharide biosynthesis
VTGAAAEAVGIEKILGNHVSKTNRELAALIVRKGLDVQVPRRGNVITVAYSNPDITLVQPVLRKVIEAYYKKHVETHKNLGVLDEFLTEETDRLAQSLRQTEEELRALKTRAGVVSLDETRRSYAERYTHLREELDTAEAELSERVAALKELQNTSTAEATGAAGTNVVTEPLKTKIAPEIITDYRRISLRLDAALAEETELRRLWSPESPRIQDIKTSIDSLVKQKKEMEAANPRLVDEPTLARTQTPDRRSVIDLPSENARVAALRARITTLTAQFNKIKADAGSVDEIETRYLELQRKKEQQELQYKYYSKNLDQARVNSQLGFGKLSNISEIQAPSLPLRDSKKLKKVMAAAAFGGIGAGFALAFLLEIVFRQSIRKPSELERNFDLPVFLTIPELDGIGPRTPTPALPGKASLALPERVNAPADSPQGGNMVNRFVEEKSANVAPWEESHTIHPYSEALRDRLMSYFELKGLTHKPKLIALTSCSEGAGVTTLAAGLAASLSETGEGNVLLVDMNDERGAAHPFFRGRPACGIADVLDIEKRFSAQVNENLFVVHGTGGDDRLPKVLPKRLAHLLPKLHASDYDYIIFDMPPITQTSVTPRLAGFMDMVFLVVEGEKTNRNWVKHATGLLKQSKASVAAVFNKRRDYVPRWLHQEF